MESDIQKPGCQIREIKGEEKEKGGWGKMLKKCHLIDFSCFVLFFWIKTLMRANMHLDNSNELCLTSHTQTMFLYSLCGSPVRPQHSEVVRCSRAAPHHLQQLDAFMRHRQHLHSCPHTALEHTHLHTNTNKHKHKTECKHP